MNANMKFPDVVDLFMSTRFGPGPNQGSHDKAKELYKELKDAYDIKPYLVDSNIGDDFSEMTMRNLAKARAMVLIACKNYGAKTLGSSSTFEELSYAYKNFIPMIVIQLCEKENWPPTPDPDIKDLVLLRIVSFLEFKVCTSLTGQLENGTHFYAPMK